MGLLNLKPFFGLLLCSLAAVPLFAGQVDTAQNIPAGIQKIVSADDSLDEMFNLEDPLEQTNIQAPLPAGLLIPSGKSDEAYNLAEYKQGLKEGKRSAHGNPLWIFGGLAGTGPCVCIGIAGIGVAGTLPYPPREDVLMGKSSPYITGYYKGYRSKARLHNALWAALGLGAAIAIDLALDFTIGFGDLIIPVTN